MDRHATIISPTCMHVRGLTDSEITKHLTYTDTAVKMQLERHMRDFAWKRSNAATWAARAENFKAAASVPLYTLRNGALFCRPGSLHLLTRTAPIPAVSKIAYPPLRACPLPLVQPFPFELHAYQKESVAALLAAKHAHVELATGTGKLIIAVALVLAAGLPHAAVIVPGKENFGSVVAEFVRFFGADAVGFFGDGKKIIGRRVTVCIAKSLALLDAQKKPDEFAFFSALDLMIVDESHTFAAASLENVCHGVLKNVPYRMFMSATQVRGGDEDNLLYAIVGPCVRSLGAKEAVESGYIAYHDFEVYSGVPVDPDVAAEVDSAHLSNPMIVRRLAFLQNKNIANIIAARCAADAAAGKASLVLVDEVGQIGAIFAIIANIFPDAIPHVALAHGETKKERLRELGLPANTAKSMNAAVDSMNRGGKLVLLATSCIRTGCSLYTIATTYNWVGGGAKNRVSTVQGAVGRSVRKWESNPFVRDIPPHLVRKQKATVVDFDVCDPQMAKHLKLRVSYYRASGTPITYIET